MQTESVATNIESSLTRRIAKNTAFMLAAQLVLRVLAFVFNVYVVRQLGEAALGRYSAALAFVAIFAVFTDLGTSQYSVREIASDESKLATLVPDTMGLRALLAIVTVVALTFSAELIGRDSLDTLGVFVASLVLLCYAYQGPLGATLVARERLDISSLMMLLRQIVFMVAGFAFLLAGFGYIGLLAATLLGVIAIGTTTHLLLRQMDVTFARPQPRRWPDLVRRSFPFAISSSSRVLSQRFDTVLMAFILTDAAVGWYNAPFNLIAMLLVMAQSLGIAIYPTLVKAYDAGRGSIDATVIRILRYLLIIAVPIMVGGWLVAERLIIVLYEDRFAPSIPVLRWLLLALPFMFVGQLFVRVVSSIHREEDAARLAVGVMIISVVFNIVLIRRIGIVGAAMTFVLARTCQIIGLVWIARGAVTISTALLPVMKVTVAALVMGAFTWWLQSNLFADAVIDSKSALLWLIGGGGAVYLMSLLLTGAIERTELAAAWQLGRARFGR